MGEDEGGEVLGGRGGFGGDEEVGVLGLEAQDVGSGRETSGEGLESLVKAAEADRSGGDGGFVRGGGGVGGGAVEDVGQEAEAVFEECDGVCGDLLGRRHDGSRVVHRPFVVLNHAHCVQKEDVRVRHGASAGHSAEMSPALK